MIYKAQQQFLGWAESEDEHQPETKHAKFPVALLDEAIQEGVAHYLKAKDITQLCQFMETAAKALTRNVGEKALRPIWAKNLPNQINRAKVFQKLCEVYGFAGYFDSAWRACVETGLDSEESNYLVFGVKCQERKFKARQAYYFGPHHRAPLTDVGRKNTADIFPLVDEELERFQARERKNLFDFYLDIAQAVVSSCADVTQLENLGQVNVEGIFERKRFQDRILAAFRSRFNTGIQPFEDQLKAVFDNPEEFLKEREQTFKRFQTSSKLPLPHKRKFLYTHFDAVCGCGEEFGLKVDTCTLKEVYQDGQHQVTLPTIPLLIRRCMERHIAKIFRRCEDRFRQSLGLRGVGQGWVSETVLFASLKKAFPDDVVIHHAKPEWIGRQHIDIYFPRLNVAIEYQGVQHGQSVAIFGGEAALRVRQRLDKKKRELCELHGCLLVEVFAGDPIEPIVEKIKARARPADNLGAPGSQAPPKAAHSSLPVRQAKPLSPQVSIKPPVKRRGSESWKKHLGKDDLPACARHGDRELVLRLASEGAGLKTFRNSDEESLLFIACKEGNVETATALLDIGLDPNARDWRKASILSKICNRWRVRPKPDIIHLLLERGADPNLHGTLTNMIFDRCGYALPMNGCAIDCFLDCAQVLFERLKNVNQRQPYSLMTPLMCICHPMCRHQHEHRSFEMIRWLVESGANLKMRSKHGFTPMDFALGASGHVDPKNLRADHISPREVLQFLWEAGARPSKLFKPILKLAFTKR